MTACKACMQDGVHDQLPLTGGPAGPLCCCSAARGEESMAVIMMAVEVGSSSSSWSATPAHALHGQCTSQPITQRRIGWCAYSGCRSNSNDLLCAACISVLREPSHPQTLIVLRHHPCSTGSQVLSPFYRLNLHMQRCSMASLTFIPYDCCPVVRWGIPVEVPCVEEIRGEQVISGPVSPSPLDAC